MRYFKMQLENGHDHYFVSENEDGPYLFVMCSKPCYKETMVWLTHIKDLGYRITNVKSMITRDSMLMRWNRRNVATLTLTELWARVAQGITQEALADDEYHATIQEMEDRISHIVKFMKEIVDHIVL